MADVVISEFMDEATAHSLMADYDVFWDPELWSKLDVLRDQMASARAVIVRNATRVTPGFLDLAPNLKVVARMGVGLDNIDVDACKARGIEVCPSIGANAVSVAEYVIATAMILLRGPAYYATADVVAGAWERSKFAGGREITGRTMGVIGYGSIGQTVGEKARALGMDVIAYDAVMPEDAPAWETTRRVDLDTLFQEADVITLHCPKLPQTIDLVDAEAFEQMKPGAILVNSARGGIVNEAACAEALKSGKIAGAALDTLDVEPIDSVARQTFCDVPNLILSPHIAGVTQESNRRIAEVAAETVRRVLGTRASVSA